MNTNDEIDVIVDSIRIDNTVYDDKSEVNTVEKRKTRVKVHVVLYSIGMTFIILTSILYFTYLLPILNFIKNPLPDDGGYNGPSLIKPGDKVVDLDDYETPAPGEDDEEIPIEETTPFPNVPSVKQISGKSLRLEKDAINILLIGADDAAGLTDTIFVASISEKKKTIKIVSIPRDTYVPYPENIRKAMKDKKFLGKGAYKINASYNVGKMVINYSDGEFDNRGINFLCSVIKGLFPQTDVTIDDYAHVNFEGFEELVGVFGGVYVDVPEDMYYPNGQCIFKKGYQFMNPTESLIYCRTRYRYNSKGENLDSPGDSYRKANQLAFLKGCANQLITADSIKKAPKILNALSNNIHHSINSLNKITEYSKIGLDYAKRKYTMELYLINGVLIDPLNDGASYVDIIS